jgi:hypothetical protein
MSDPVSGTTVAAGGLMGASMFGLATGIDYGVVFGAFAGAVFYVATAVNISRLKLVGYFITSFIFGVIGAPLLGSYFSKWTGYSDRPLDALGAVIAALRQAADVRQQSGFGQPVWNSLAYVEEGPAMVTSDPSAMANAFICGVIVIALMFYQRGGARHRPWYR